MAFWPTSSNPGPQLQEGTFCFIKKRQNSATSEPLISFLVFVIGTLWPKNHKTNNCMID